MENFMQKKSNKRKFTIAVLSLLVGLSLTATIVLAAFSAQKTSTATISFANGVTLELAAIDSNASIHVNASAASQSGTFTFDTTNTSDLETTTTVNGIKAKLMNQDAYLGYKVQLVEVVTANNESTEQTISGSWSNSSGTVTFTPTGTKTNWKAVLTVNTTNFPTISASGDTVTAASTAALTKEASYFNLFSSIVFDGVPTGSMNDLAGRSVKLKFDVKADTAAAVTFS